jgi:hypothetical protein
MSCTIDHNADGAIPELLCRHCHPARSLTPAEIKAADKADRAARLRTLQRESKQRELRTAQLKLESLTRLREPDPQSLSGKIAASLRKKIKKLDRALANTS